MTDWSPGGFLWSLNRKAKKEVRDQLRSNPVALRAKYRWPTRVMRLIFSTRTFMRFLGLYLFVDLLVIVLEMIWNVQAPEQFPRWSRSSTATDLVKNVPSYLIGAQVGILGVISLALALVTLIAQRDEAATDVQVYYHESMFFEISASCLALTAVMCAQLLWPLQFGIHLLNYGGNPVIFKVGLIAFHIMWLTINLAAVASFIAITFSFVQRGARERLRERYTANVIVPHEMTDHVRSALYSMAGTEAIPTEGENVNPTLFGWRMPEPCTVELVTQFKHPVRLKNVLVRPAHWAIRRWKHRCDKLAADGDPQRQSDRSAPFLWFAPQFNQTLRGETEWCHRNGGVPLDRIERLVLRVAFRFERVRDAD